VNSPTATSGRAANITSQQRHSPPDFPIDNLPPLESTICVPTPESVSAAASSANATDRLQNVSKEAGSLTFDTIIEPGLIDLSWQWDDAFNLDASFCMEDVSTYDLNTVTPGLPWLPLQVPVDDSQDMELYDSSLTQAFPQNTSHPSPTPGASSPRNRGTQSLQIVESMASSEEEISRDLLSASLNRRAPEAQIPTTAFLNRCIKMFTTRLWPLVPVIHLPSFRPSQAHPLLLLSVCSLGALADGSGDALYYANKLFESVQRTILISCSTFTDLGEDILQVLQAAIIGQTFAILSGKRSRLPVAQAFHGLLSVAANTYQDHLRDQGHMLDSSNTGTVHVEDWDRWVQNQSFMRIMSVLHVHDGELATTMSHPGMLSKHPSQASRAAPNELFLTKIAEE
jgi:hypothetical protein